MGLPMREALLTQTKPTTAYSCALLVQEDQEGKDVVI